MPGLGLSIGVWRGGASSAFAPIRNLTTTPTADSIQVDWFAPSRGIPDSYQVELSEGGVWGNQQSVTPPTTTYTYSGLSAGTYFVRVRSIYSGGSSSWRTSGEIDISVTYELEVTTYQANIIANGGSISNNSLNIVNTFVVSAKANGYWSKYRLLLPFLGNNLAAALTPLVNTDSVTIINHNFVDADFLETTGLNPGISNTKYLDLGWNPSLLVSNPDSVHMSAYMMSDSFLSNPYPIILAANDGSNRFGLQIKDIPSYSYFDCYALTADRASDSVGSAVGLWVGSRLSANSSGLYHNETVITENGNTRSGNLPNSNVLAFTYSPSDSNGFENRPCSFITIGEGLTSTDISNFSDDLNALNAAIGRS